MASNWKKVTKRWGISRPRPKLSEKNIPKTYSKHLATGEISLPNSMKLMRRWRREREPESIQSS